MTAWISIRWLRPLTLGWIITLTIAMAQTATVRTATAQPPQPSTPDPQRSSQPDFVPTFIVKTNEKPPKLPPLFTVRAQSVARITADRITQRIGLDIKVVQGTPEKISLELIGDAAVTQVNGPNIRSWAVRREKSKRFLELFPKNKTATGLTPQVVIESDKINLPATVDLTHLAPGKAIGFDSIVRLQFAAAVDGKVEVAEGFFPIQDTNGRTNKKHQPFQSATGGRLSISLSPSGAAAKPIQWTRLTLDGQLDADSRSILFKYRGTANVTQPNVSISVLSGNAALARLPESDGYHLTLNNTSRPRYELTFPRPGTFDVELDFIAAVTKDASELHAVEFTVSSSAIVPMKLSGMPANTEFVRGDNRIIPTEQGGSWAGFLPATGRLTLVWRATQDAGEGKLFFSTVGKIESKVGAGLMRQNHHIEYQILQGELDSLSFALRGPGQILDVQGKGQLEVVRWKVTDTDEGQRQLDVSISSTVTSKGELEIRSQTPLDAFPVQVETLRLVPIGAIRHSGYLRLSNSGSVRLEPTGRVGLTQLGPGQFPGPPMKSRQKFVFRFPADDYSLDVIADRIATEVNVSTVSLYQVGPTDKVIHSDVELDIREAGIGSWDITIPADYSVVSATGAAVADYVAATETNDGRRNLKIVFGSEVLGRQLIALHLEKNEPTGGPTWQLPRLGFPTAKTVRGTIGVASAAGLRVAPDQVERLAEKPLSYFPKSIDNLQQAFRIRSPDWSATMQIEKLDRIIQADVFHLYSLSQETVYGSVLINYFVTGAPVSELKVAIPGSLGNINIDGQDIRTWRMEGDQAVVSLHHPVMGAYTLLVTFEENPQENQGRFNAGKVAPIDVRDEQGYVQVVSPMQVDVKSETVSDDVLRLDPLELPAEFRLLRTAPALGTWQYTQRPFNLTLAVDWFDPGTTASQIVEFSEANTRVSRDGQSVTDLLYYVKSRGQMSLRIRLPDAPVRLWEVSVNGKPVTARQSEGITLVPLPGETGPNQPIEVRLRLGKPAAESGHVRLSLPVIESPVIKTQWNVTGDENRVLIPAGGTVRPVTPTINRSTVFQTVFAGSTVQPSTSVIPESGFAWIARYGLGLLIGVLILAAAGMTLPSMSRLGIWAGMACSLVASMVGLLAVAWTWHRATEVQPLQLSLPILAAGEKIELQVHNAPDWMLNFSWLGLAVFLCGLAVVVAVFVKPSLPGRSLLKVLSGLLVALGILLQHDRGGLFFLMLTVSILGTATWAHGRAWIAQWQRVGKWLFGFMTWKRKTDSGGDATPKTTTAVTTTVLLVAIVLSSATQATAQIAEGIIPADSMTQQWNINSDQRRVLAKGTVRVSGRPGDRFVLLAAPATLTRFEGQGLRLTKEQIVIVSQNADQEPIPAANKLAYVISIPASEKPNRQAEDKSRSDSADAADVEPSHWPDVASEPQRVSRTAEFEFLIDAVQFANGIPILTGSAAVQQIQLELDRPGWDVLCSAAVRTEVLPTAAGTVTNAKILLGGNLNMTGLVVLRPKARDLSAEETRFFVEASHLYLPSSGVVDGHHRLDIRPAQGQVERLSVKIPDGLTVSSVDGPVGSWQFDAAAGNLQIAIGPAQSQPFSIAIGTQRSLAPLPVTVNLEPLRVTAASGEVGLVAVAFGPDAQPEKITPTGMSTVNSGDFDLSLVRDLDAVVHQVFRYGNPPASLSVRSAPVAPEVRVTTREVISLGDERVVSNLKMNVEISRTGLFQLSFQLPVGIEVESLTGPALHHWSERVKDATRTITMHLAGKTLGTHSFAMILSSPAPSQDAPWQLPRFEVAQATRQTGQLIIQPTTGIRLRTLSRANVSETDPRSLGSKSKGSLAFRLLQQDWSLSLGIEKLAPWVSGEVLHDVLIRERQTRQTILADLEVQNASLRSLRVALPGVTGDQRKTVRVSGEGIADLVPTSPDSEIWQLQFKRRVVGKVQFRIEFERRGDQQQSANQTIRPARIVDARQINYHTAIRASGRLELSLGSTPSGWQPQQWNRVAQSLRRQSTEKVGGQQTPAIVMRAISPTMGLTVQAKRQSLAEALKLRVAQGKLTTVLSPTGDQLTAVQLTMDVIRRSSLSVSLPEGSELLNLFVNGESVNSIRHDDDSNRWQFYVLPGLDDRTASVEWVYAVMGHRLSRMNLVSPQLNVPLEGIQWNVITPKGFELSGHDGNLELISRSRQAIYDRSSYLSKAGSKRDEQAKRATELLRCANDLLQQGAQDKASWALNGVANQYALNAASNEDARVQLENLYTQNVIVGLNTRRQRLFLENARKGNVSKGNQQFRQAAAANPVLQQAELNFRPQEVSQLLRGNTIEDNNVLQRIAGRLVAHQHSNRPAAASLQISLPEEGLVYQFTRSVQVAEDAPLELDLQFTRLHRTGWWQAITLGIALLGTFASIVWVKPTSWTSAD